MPLRLLFVCSMNQWRSPTAEAIYRNHTGVAVRSGGTSPKARRRVSATDIHWADLILVMEEQHRERLKRQFPDAYRQCRIEVLEIEDRYRAMDPRLVTELRSAIDPLLEDELA
ncbi:phosphotyrosine protein phosphatase [Roseibacillus persicicus]|uniref:Phosphotyrosine protein phosphatase n=1 Tax=Roseibacillus persicicus TaxID=454148 RepID=A0A918TVK1_9BACT|nr:phosphotyrosine protein phosphatase [Roseibacillus persicicus]GHC63259.1 phosphotyrosine protein phosphatase [Roseibacillus persicicus]